MVATKNELKRRKRIRNYNYYLRNRERLINKVKKWKKLNPEKVIENNKKAFKNYYQKNKEKIILQTTKYKKLNKIKRSIFIKQKRLNNNSFVIKERIRSSFKQVFKLYSSGKKFKSKKYGIDYSKIIEYLKPFPKDIKKYHIDHIIPLSYFNFNNPIEIKLAFAPENHQWLLAKENLSKGNKIILGGK